MTTQEKVIKTKLGLLELGKHLGNVSRACKIMGYSRDSYYRFKELFDEYGDDGLRDLNRSKPNVKNRVAPEIEDAVCGMAISQPAYGQVRVSNELKKQGHFVSPGGVRSIWKRHDLETFKKRLKALEVKMAQENLILTAADLLNDRVVPFFESQGIPLLRILTDRGTEYCGKLENHEYQLYLSIEDIDHTKTKARSPQTNGVCERFHRTVLNEFYQVAFRKKIYTSLEELQRDLDQWLEEYNTTRPHSGKWCDGRTPMQTFLDSSHIAKEKMIGYEQQEVSQYLTVN